MTDTTVANRTQAEPQIVQPEPTPKLPAKAALRGGGAIAPIVPQDFEQAWRMAEVIAAAGMAPKSFMTKDPKTLVESLSVPRITLAIMAGLEVGLPPMQAIQGIAVINGMPTIYGDARDGLVAASGLLDDMKEEMELDDDGLFVSATCTIWRRGRKTPISQTITRPQAARAGWLKKTGPWTENPNRMAQMRAKGWASRDAFPDVLKGLVDYDEALDMVDVTARGNVTTAPPEPRRADFRPTVSTAEQNATEAEEGQREETEGWPLHDETGETVGRYGNLEWARRLEDAAVKLEGAERTSFLQNNADIARQVWEEVSDDAVAARLREIYTPPATEPEKRKNDWSLPPDVVGQEKRQLAIYKQLEDQTETPEEVEDLWNFHQAFFDKMVGIKRAAAKKRFDDRAAMLKPSAGQ